MVILEGALVALASAFSPKIAKDIIELAEKLDQKLGKFAKTRTGKKAAQKALIFLLSGGKETDAEFLKLVAQFEDAGVNTQEAHMVRGVIKKTAYKKPAAKKAAAKRPAAKMPAARKLVAKKPAAKMPAARKLVAKKPAAKKPAARKATA